jgi:hypothetical protein
MKRESDADNDRNSKERRKKDIKSLNIEEYAFREDT